MTVFLIPQNKFILNKKISKISTLKINKSYSVTFLFQPQDKKNQLILDSKEIYKEIRLFYH